MPLLESDAVVYGILYADTSMTSLAECGSRPSDAAWRDDESLVVSRCTLFAKSGQWNASRRCVWLCGVRQTARMHCMQNVSGCYRFENINLQYGLFLCKCELQHKKRMVKRERKPLDSPYTGDSVLAEDMHVHRTADTTKCFGWNRMEPRRCVKRCSCTGVCS